MKKFLSLFASFALALGSCDVIEPNERLETPVIPGGNDTTKIDTNGLNGLRVQRKILLEDFTGAECTNCPDASRLAKQLEDVYGERLIVLGIHAGQFAAPKPPKTSYDFRTTAGTEIHAVPEFKPQGYPAGMVNRTKPKSGNSIVLGRGSWGSAVKAFIDDTSNASIQVTLKPSYNPATRQITVDTKAWYLSESTGDYYLSVFMTEDSIIQVQLDNGTYIQDYVHMHVLRGSMNGTWGDPLATGTKVPRGRYVEKKYTYTIPENSDWKPEHMKILGIVHKYGSNREVVQVERAKLIK